MKTECPLSSALLSYLTGGEGSPLKVSVSVTPSDEVTALRSQVAALEAELAMLRTEHNRSASGSDACGGGALSPPPLHHFPAWRATLERQQSPPFGTAKA